MGPSPGLLPADLAGARARSPGHGEAAQQLPGISGTHSPGTPQAGQQGRGSTDSSSGGRPRAAAARQLQQGTGPGTGDADAGADAELWEVAEGAQLMAGDGGDDWEDGTCGVCLEASVQVAVAGCGHALCAACARRVCEVRRGRPPCCPFCRLHVSGFQAAARLGPG